MVYSVQGNNLAGNETNGIGIQSHQKCNNVSTVFKLIVLKMNLIRLKNSILFFDRVKVLNYYLKHGCILLNFIFPKKYCDLI